MHTSETSGAVSSLGKKGKIIVGNPKIQAIHPNNMPMQINKLNTFYISTNQ